MWLNRGIFHRPFTRACLLAKIENRWYTMREVSSKISASPKTVRNIFAECRDLKSIDHRYHGNRLVLQASTRGVRMYYRYIKSLFENVLPLFDDYFRDMQEYQRLKNMADPTTLDPQKKVEATS